MADAGTNPPAPPLRLIKQRTWSPHSELEEAWLRRKGLHQDRRETSRLRKSITDEDVSELCACIDLGFGFEPESHNDIDAAAAADADGGRRRRLSETFPALDLYYAVNRRYREFAAESSPSSSDGYGDSDSSDHSPISFFSPDDSPETTKARLRQWAQVVACCLRQRR